MSFIAPSMTCPGGFVPHATHTPAGAETIAKPLRSFIAARFIPLKQEVFTAKSEGPAATGQIYADIRAFWIYDGPSEAHRAAIACRAVARIQRASA